MRQSPKLASVGNLADEPRPDQQLVIVQVRPKGAGPWSWPHTFTERAVAHPFAKAVEFDWVSITCELPPRNSRKRGVRITGWTAGLNDDDQVPWDRVEEIVDAWFDAHDEESWAWEFRLAVL